MDKSLLLAQKEQAEMLPAFDGVLLFSLERRYLEMVDMEQLEMATNTQENDWNWASDLRMLKVEEVSYEDGAKMGLHLLNMQNVLASMKDDSHNVISVIHSTKEKTSLYYGLSKRVDGKAKISTDEYAKILKQSLHGNFLGVRVHQMKAEEIEEEILDPIEFCENVMAFPGIPSLRRKDPQGPYVQGIDRFVEGMRGEEYCLVTIAEPIPLPVVDGIIKNLFDLSSSIHSQVKATVQKMKGSSDTVNVGMFGMSGSNEAQTVSDANTNSSTSLGGGGVASGGGAAVGGVIGGVLGSVFPLIGTAIGTGVGSLIGGAIGTIGTWVAGGTLTKTEAFTHSVANTIGRMTGLGGQGGYARGWNRSQAVTQEVLNKTAEYCEKLCDAYIERLQAGKNLGLWNVGVYLLTDNRYTQLRAQGLLRAAFSGDTTYWEPMRSLQINHEAIARYIMNFNNPKYDLFLYGEERKSIREAVSTGQKIKNYAAKMGKAMPDILSRLAKGDAGAAEMLEEIRRCPDNYSQEDFEKAWKEVKRAELGHPFGEIMGGVSTPLNTEELSIIMNVPRQEVQGITIREAAPFGVNYVPSHDGKDVRLGRVVHKRMPMDDIPYVIPQSLFQKHAFVCGVTGSGKTNTCMTLLKNLKKPFLVVEPAKTEYRQMLNFIPDLRVFTLGSESVSPFRINPFEFAPGCELLTHIDSIKAVFNAAFPMYASMPYILEEAIIRIYEEKGWDLATSTNKKGLCEYPTLEDLEKMILVVVREKAYAPEQTMNLQAALMARLSSLRKGSKGLMLNVKRSTPLSELLEHPVILELKNIGDDDEKCFIMGLILSSIYQYRENYGSIGNELKHVLLIEEAHRLLRRTPEFVSPEIGNSRGKAVETFTNVISEIREYGQGIIIVDQVPSKLTPDVVKNTNIKIIHRTLAQDDREYVGSTMNLTEAQDRELCLLEQGQAVIHREGMDKAFLVQIDPQEEGMKPITNDCVREHMKRFSQEQYYGLDKREGLSESFNREDFHSDSESLLHCSIAALLLMMMGEDSSLEEVRKSFADNLKKEFNIDEALRIDAYVIHYANLLFKWLCGEYHEDAHKYLRTQRLFLDAWFGEKVDVKVLRFDIQSLTKGMRGENFCAGILRMYLRSFVQPDTDSIARLVEAHHYLELDDLLDSVLCSVLCGVNLPSPKLRVYKRLLLKEMLAMVKDYSIKSNLESYSKFLRGKGEQ